MARKEAGPLKGKNKRKDVKNNGRPKFKNGVVNESIFQGT
jgi:hypothetical protein